MGSIHSYVMQADIPPDVADVELFQVTRETLLTGVISQTKGFAAASKTAASLWPPPLANETAINSVRFTSFFFLFLFFLFFSLTFKKKKLPPDFPLLGKRPACERERTRFVAEGIGRRAPAS